MDVRDRDREFLAVAIEQARIGRSEGGVPIGGALVADGRVLAAGRNRRGQTRRASPHRVTVNLRGARASSRFGQ